jgi:hypothetical protein
MHHRVSLLALVEGGNIQTLDDRVWEVRSKHRSLATLFVHVQLPVSTTYLTKQLLLATSYHSSSALDNLTRDERVTTHAIEFCRQLNSARRQEDSLVLVRGVLPALGLYEYSHAVTTYEVNWFVGG